jgi:Ser/Thr protein kinase RdoA (MazF antagonist)
MMKLKHLFNNPDLAQMLLKNWEYDEPSLDMFQYYRISANAIYPFARNGEVCLLRFCPTSEKTKESLAAELDFISYLRSHHYNALEPVASKTGEELVQQSTPWGDYFAGVFKRVKGEQLSEIPLDDNIVVIFGSALGLLHKLSTEYAPAKSKRWTHVDALNWIETTLGNIPSEGSSLEEVTFLRESFSRLPMNQANYGLVHYDFELDNVFYDHMTESCSVIDFDDAMYHWYVMDIEQALDSLKEAIGEHEFHQKEALFLDGYRSQFDIAEELWGIMPLLRRFANLYGYARIMRSIQEHWENEPEWLVELRAKLDQSLRNRAKYFHPSRSLPNRR